MKIDLHFHLRTRKENYLDKMIEMIGLASNNGIEGLVLLNHNYYPTDNDVACAKSNFPQLIFFKGIELDVKDEARGIKDHIVIISENKPPFDCSHGVTTKNLKLLKAFSKDSFTFLAHPLTRHNNFAFDFYDFLPNGIEIAQKTGFSQEQQKEIMRLSSFWGMRLLSCSDSHLNRHVGKFCIEIKKRVSNVGELKKEILSGEYFLLKDMKMIVPPYV